ncbi:hypothetical protein [Caldilinea sp.]|uniref:hypothetical protein n=1 Tax=Caldilinea sp. TaxID=2293560 RepID=UPI002BFD7ECF|nr:hypothetical protein [Caldilinea sp.]
MKKDDKELDELRPEYQRENFVSMVRGKSAKRMKESTNIVVLDPDNSDSQRISIIRLITPPHNKAMSSCDCKVSGSKGSPAT